MIRKYMLIGIIVPYYYLYKNKEILTKICSLQVQRPLFFYLIKKIKKRKKIMIYLVGYIYQIMLFPDEIQSTLTVSPC